MLGPLCAFLSAVTWAWGSANYARLSREYSAFSINFGRALVALPMFVLAAFITQGGLQGGSVAYSEIRSSHVMWFGLSMIGSYGLGDLCFFLSTRSLGVPGALAIASAYPIWTTLGGVLTQGDGVSFKQLLGLLVTVAGVAIVILNAPQSAKSEQQGLGKRWIGVTLALATSFFWALNSFSVSRGGQGLTAPVGNTLRMLFALAITFSLNFLVQNRRSILLPRIEFRRCFWLFAVEAFGGSYFFLYGISHSPLIVGATLTSLAPVLSVPVAWALKTEKLSWARTIGVLLTVVGLWLLVRGY